ncbi:hypothetical protein K402DRAFT_336046 [Aulographum hederae CBS 113979]|uniref:CHCH domain-containing protein n=1 Tax=Aulographum hederae CBS 113979 TaxID=1176131 RepID=A0A6G1GU93_9PEZI|nr:hypothetical protein K402DRAFT_336046 [Aulographum hederae CBS 113979]
MVRKDKSQFLDPCQEAASRSIKCLTRNGGDKEFCQDYFEAYRQCKKEWVRIPTTLLIPYLRVRMLNGRIVD